MSAILRSVDGQLDSIDLRFASRCDLRGDQDELPAESWSVEIRWIDFEEDSGDVKESTIGRAHAVVVDLYRCSRERNGVAGVLDAMSGDLAEFCKLYDDASGDWVDDLDDMASLGTAALIIESLELDAAYRGNGLGPAILAAIIDRLGRGCGFVAVYPSPMGDPLDGKSRDEAVEALARTWEQLGFEPFRDGVWVLDLAVRTFDDRRRELLSRLD